MTDVEVDINSGGNSKAVIEGKTSVPFKTFVTLVLQRKVQTLFKTSQDEPVIIGSALLTQLASAPDDRQEDRSKLVLVVLGVGVLAGVALSAIVLLVLSLFKILPSQTELGITAGVIIAVGLLVWALLNVQKKAGMRQKFYESMEKMTDLVR